MTIKRTFVNGIANSMTYYGNVALAISDKEILLKKGVRADSVWTRRATYHRPLIEIPFALDIGALMRSQYWPRERMLALQETRIASLLRGASRIPLWKRRFGESGVDPKGALSIRDLQRLPIISKSAFDGLDPSEFTEAAWVRRAHLDHTSGSTGRPFEFSFDWGAELRSYAICERMFRTAAGGTRYPVITMRTRHKIGFAFKRTYFFFLRGYNSVKHRLPDFLATAARFPRGVILYGYASCFLELARRAQEAGARPAVKAIISTGESIRESDRLFIEEALSTRFYLTYATRELGWLGYQCEERAMHINEEWAYLETVDGSGKPTAAGSRGRIIVTPFDNRVMPLIRYDSGDVGTISDARCACGRTSRTIQIVGRQMELIDVGDGRTVSLLDISVAFDSFARAVRQYQIVQKEPLAFLIKVVPADTFAEMRDALEGYLIRMLHPDARIEWEIVEEIPPAQSGKALYFVRA